MSNNLLHLSIILIFGIPYMFTVRNGDNSHAMENNVGLEPMVSFGEKLNDDQWLYVVGIGSEGYINDNPTLFTSTCTGSLISPIFVITAAHCYPNVFDNTSNKTNTYVYKSICPNYGFNQIKYGDTSVIRRRVTTYNPHYNFNIKNADKTNLFDVMIITIESPFDGIPEYSKLYGCIQMFIRNKKIQTVGTGCGSTPRTDKNLNETMTQYYEKERQYVNMTTTYGKRNCNLPEYKWKNFVCNVPSRHGLCPGDSGGPLLLYFPDIQRHKQIGVLSYATAPHCNAIPCGCKTNLINHVFLYMLKDWIAKNSQLEFEDCSSEYGNKRKQKRLKKFIDFKFQRNSNSANKKCSTKSTKIIMYILFTFYKHYKKL